MKLLIPSLALAFACFAPITSVFAADQDTTKGAHMSAYNTTCPVCEKHVDAKAKTATMVNRPNSKHHDMAGSKVGFCSDACHTTYTKDPAKYDEKLEPQWLESKNKQVKGS